MVQQPVFVGGFRSGSTLLINLLGLHPQVAPWFETKSLCEALRWQRVLGDPSTEAFEHYVLGPRQSSGFSVTAVAERMRWHMHHTAQRMAGQIADGKAPHERYPLQGDAVLYSLEEAQTALHDWRRSIHEPATETAVAAATGALIRTLGKRQVALAARPLWINKTPEIPRFGGELRRGLGRCRIIHLIRDGRQVVHSAVALGWGDMERMTRLWKAMIELSRAAALAEDYLEIRYEKLIQAPATTLDRVCTFLELDLRGKALWKQYRHLVGQTPQPIPHQGPASLCRQELSTFNAIAGELSRELGYG